MNYLHRLARCTALLPLILTFLRMPTTAQDAPSSPDAPHRPRIGLALSGGGALGLAEIGIIQWMHENHIPVDRIAGTSMGAIIGAMYATGMSPAEMKTFVKAVEAYLEVPVKYVSNGPGRDQILAQ